MASSSASIYEGDINIRQQIIASSVGAFLTSAFVTPMDVVKIRLQSQIKPLAEGECFLYSNGLMDHLCTHCAREIKIPGTCEWYNRPGQFRGTLVGTMDAFVKITRFEGIRSLWSGLSPTMLSAIPATVFYFTLYDNLLATIRRRIGNHHYDPLIAGTLARTVAVTVVAPIELVRTKMQSEQLSYRELTKAIKTTVSNDGYSSLWRGWSATMMRDLPFSAIYWTGYEFLKHHLLRIQQTEKTNFTVSFLCGAFSGSVAAAVTLPFDVIKTHKQITLGTIEYVIKQHNPSTKLNANASTFGAMKELVQTKGVSSLFTGMVPRVARVAPACAIMIGSYEYLKLFFSRRNNNREKH